MIRLDRNMATSDSNYLVDGTRLPPPDNYEEASPSGEVLMRRSNHAMGDSSGREVVKLSRGEYMDLMGEIRTLHDRLDKTKTHQQHSGSQSRDQSPEGRRGGPSRDRSADPLQVDRACDRDVAESSSVYNTPRALVGRNDTDGSGRRLITMFLLAAATEHRFPTDGECTVMEIMNVMNTLKSEWIGGSHAAVPMKTHLCRESTNNRLPMTDEAAGVTTLFISRW